MTPQIVVGVRTDEHGTQDAEIVLVTRTGDRVLLQFDSGDSLDLDWGDLCVAALHPRTTTRAAA